MLKSAIIGTEIDTLRGMSLLAQVLYVLGIRPRMDFGTGVAGGFGPKRVTVDALRTVAEFVPDRGSNKRYSKPSRGQIRAAVKELERRGLLEDVGCSRHGGLIFFLPLAVRDESVQNMNARENGVGTTKGTPEFNGLYSVDIQALNDSSQGYEQPYERQEQKVMSDQPSGKHLNTNTRGGGTRARAIATPEAELAIALRTHFVDVTSQHPVLRGWVERGVTEAMAMEAVEIAKQTKAGKRIPANYLAPIIERMLEQQQQPATIGRSGNAKSERISQNERSRRRGIEHLRASGELSDAEWCAHCETIGEPGRSDPIRAGDGDPVAAPGGDLPQALGAEDGGAGLVGLHDLDPGAGRRDH